MNQRIILVLIASAVVINLIIAIGDAHGQIITNPDGSVKQAPSSKTCIIYNSHIGVLAEGKNLDVVDTSCPQHVKTIADLLANEDYHIIAVVPTNNGSEVYITNK